MFLLNYFDAPESQQFFDVVRNLQFEQLSWFIEGNRTVGDVNEYLTFAERGIDNCCKLLIIFVLTFYDRGALCDSNDLE